MSHSNPTTVTLPDIPDGVTAHDLSELRLLHSDLRKIMGTAREYGVRCVIDAEHSWFQVSRCSQSGPLSPPPRTA